VGFIFSDFFVFRSRRPGIHPLIPLLLDQSGESGSRDILKFFPSNLPPTFSPIEGRVF